MGLFDRFRKKVQIAASEADTESLTAEEGSDEAIEAINQHQEIPNLVIINLHQKQMRTVQPLRTNGKTLTKMRI